MAECDKSMHKRDMLHYILLYYILDHIISCYIILCYVILSYIMSYITCIIYYNIYILTKSIHKMIPYVFRQERGREEMVLLCVLLVSLIRQSSGTVVH